jgi:DNA-binding transcriptional ArsR family regulator
MYGEGRKPDRRRVNPPTLVEVGKPEAIDAAFKALANETRRGILAMLHDFGGYMTSAEIAGKFDLPWQSISRHLKILTEARLLTYYIDGRDKAFTLDRDHLWGLAGRWVYRASKVGEFGKDGVLRFDFTEEPELPGEMLPPR